LFVQAVWQVTSVPRAQSRLPLVAPAGQVTGVVEASVPPSAEQAMGAHASSMRPPPLSMQVQMSRVAPPAVPVQVP
jgi:hypothetical protein